MTAFNIMYKYMCAVRSADALDLPDVDPLPPPTPSSSPPLPGASVSGGHSMWEAVGAAMGEEWGHTLRAVCSTSQEREVAGRGAKRGG